MSLKKTLQLLNPQGKSLRSLWITADLRQINKEGRLSKGELNKIKKQADL